MRFVMTLTLILLIALSGATAGFGRTATNLSTDVRANISATDRIAVAERRVVELERKNLILEASDQIEDKAYSRFEIGMGGLGLLITLLVLVFGFRTERAAMRAAQAEVADRKTQIDDLVALAKPAAAAAEAAATSAAQHEGRAATSAAHVEETSKAVEAAAQIANELSSRRADLPAPDLTIDQKQALEQGAKEAKKQREADLTADEFRARIAKAAYVDSDWEEAIRLARGMAFVHADDLEALTYAHYEEAFALGQLGKNQESIQVYDKAVELCRESQNPKLRGLLVILLFNRGVRLGLIGDSQGEILAYDEVIKESNDLDQEEGIQENVGRALYNKGATLYGMNRHNEAIAAYDELISRFSEKGSDEFRDQVSRATLAKATAIGNIGDADREISAYDDMISKFDPLDKPAICRNVATAYVNKAIAVGKLGRTDEEIAGYKQTIANFADFEDDEVALQVAKATLYLGITYAETGESAKAREAYEDALVRLKILSLEGADALRQQAEMALAVLEAPPSESSDAGDGNGESG